MAELDAYRRKRDFASTPEPRGERAATGERIFVIQQHAARRLHYDLRLEHDGVLRSWAVPKGPSLDPRERRLAVRTEDHPIEYADFEGTIPAGQYGAGRVLVWDRGTWTPEGDPARDLARGRLRFTLDGDKLHGRWNLVRIKDEDNWLLIKSRDEFARSGEASEIVDTLPNSVISGRTIDDFDETTESDPLPLVTPQLATLAERAPAGPRWLHEIKLDGYRILAYVRAGAVRLRTRGGEDWTAKLPELAQALGHSHIRDSILDGELCMIGADGLCSFDRLQKALAERRTAGLVYSVFDLPVCAGEDLRERPLLERKQALARLLEPLADPRIRYWSHVIGSGPEVLDRACALGAEGVISKRVDSTYEGRRTRTWVKAKCPRRIAVVVGGFTPPRGGRRHFGALLMGSYDGDGRLRYRGKVGAGFGEARLAELAEQLEPLRRDRPAFVDPPTGAEARGVVWVAPELAIEVEYGDVTDQGKLRQARYVGPHAAVDPPAGAALAAPRLPASVRLTHPERLLYPELGLSKRDVADYVMQVAAWMLPHVRERPLTLVRCPDGVGGECFYQKHAMPGLPASVVRVAIPESGGGGTRTYASVADPLGLVGLVQMSVIEIHTWGSRIDRLERPDRLVFDLDPDVALGFAEVVAAALELRERLAVLGLRSFVKTTGGKGLHVVVPIARELEFGPAKGWCREFAQQMAADAPDRYTTNLEKAERRGRIFIDYLRNGRGATSVAPYSLRARPRAPVSTPLDWDELRPELRPELFDIRTVPARLAGLDRDPWADLLELRQAIAGLV